MELEICYGKDRLWRLVILGKYEEEEQWLHSNEGREGFGVGLWKTTRRGWTKFLCRTSLMVADSRRDVLAIFLVQ